MLACARIGAPHSVVFGGFSPDSLVDRINDAECKVVITADGGFRRGAPSMLKPNVDTALASTPSVEHVVVVAARRRARRHGRGPRPLVARPDGAGRRRVPVRADGQRGPALPALHVGHDGEAQGHHAHDRRLPHPGRLHAQVRLRPQARRRRLLVRRRHRLGHRPQLHRLRAAHEPGHVGDLRGHARHARARTGCGTSPSATASRSSTPRRPPSARS